MANSNKSKIYHYIYKTTNLINKKYYVGMHSTNNLEDGYLGSGTYLWRAIKKYGKENFKRETLHWCSTREELIELEKKIVNTEFLKEEFCMNLKPGGSGGFSSEEHAKKFYLAGAIATNHIKWVINKEENFKKCSVRFKKMWEDPSFRKAKKEQKNFKGKQHSQEAKRKIGEANAIRQKGEGNSQFGSMWINNGVESRKIKKDSIIPDGWSKGRKQNY